MVCSGRVVKVRGSVTSKAELERQRIQVTVESGSGDVVVCAFFGRWLLAPEAGVAPDRRSTYGVAATDRGNIVVYARDAGFRRSPSLEFYERFDDIPSNRLPDNARELAARALGQQFVVRLDP